MIFKINQAFYDSLSAPVRSQLYCDMIQHGHYVDCHPKLREMFYSNQRNNFITRNWGPIIDELSKL